MRRAISIATLATVILFALGMLAQGARDTSQDTSLPEQTGLRTPQAGHVYIPESSIQRPEDLGLRAHTNIVLFSLDGVRPLVLRQPSDAQSVINDSSVSVPETPASLGCVYLKNPNYSGCVPNSASGTGGPSPAGYGAIALVDAYDNPDAATDLQTFDSYWGLPAPPHFIKVLATNASLGCGTPVANAGWSLESSLDIEYAHVFATSAAIILVEASNNSDTCLFYAEQVAFNYLILHYTYAGQVSNSYGGGEFSGQTAYDPYFASWNYTYNKQVTAFASTGDDGCGVEYPSSNPWVIAAGGTTVLRNSSDHSFSSEACWGGSGGGTSTVETYATSWTGGSNTGPWANYQYPVFGEANRSVPDISFDADPHSGAYVYSQYGGGGWVVVGGTSLASPSLAGIVNRSNNKLGSFFDTPVTGNHDFFANQEDNLIYAQMPAHSDYTRNWYDVKTGSNGCSNSATTAYDFCTGVGSPRGTIGK
ncbi:MAG: hypothetical protein WA655_04340 [Candidatus Korobacteraceae bacterium]